MNAKPLGWNPLRWECERDGCFNKLKRPKIEQFAECFPGKINFSDVDGIVEISGNALLMEWKPDVIEFSKGQRIMYERLTVGRRFSVLCIAGNAETMIVSHQSGFVDGRFRQWKPATLGGVKTAIRGWVIWARKHPRLGG